MMYSGILYMLKGTQTQVGFLQCYTDMILRKHPDSAPYYISMYKLFLCFYDDEYMSL